ncbi:hypothetical protein ACFLYL_04825 [Chloroflexota bacterium]
MPKDEGWSTYSDVISRRKLMRVIPGHYIVLREFPERGDSRLEEIAECTL